MNRKIYDEYDPSESRCVYHQAMRSHVYAVSCHVILSLSMAIYNHVSPIMSIRPRCRLGALAICSKLACFEYGCRLLRRRQRKGAFQIQDDLDFDFLLSVHPSTNISAGHSYVGKVTVDLLGSARFRTLSPLASLGCSPGVDQTEKQLPPKHTELDDETRLRRILKRGSHSP